MLPPFTDDALIERALTHTSYSNENPGIAHNERLEFLGDSVLNFIVADWLYHRYADLGEGRLTTLRAALIKAGTLRTFADRLELADHLRLGRGEHDSGGKRRTNILADAFEAVLAAVYLDQGMTAARDLLEPLLSEVAPGVLQANLDRDPKTRLQEWSQEYLAMTPTYKLIGTEGPAHERLFTVELWLGERMLGTGSGATKQMAEQSAAAAALDAGLQVPETPAEVEAVSRSDSPAPSDVAVVVAIE